MGKIIVLINVFLGAFALACLTSFFKFAPAYSEVLQAAIFYAEVALTLGILVQGCLFISTLALSHEDLSNQTVFQSMVRRLTTYRNSRACLFGLWFLITILALVASDWWLLSVAVASRTLSWLIDIHTEILYEKRGLDLKSIKQDPAIKYLLEDYKKKDRSKSEKTEV